MLKLSLSLLILVVLQGTLSVRILEMVIPPVAKVGDNVTLQCIYDSEGEELYAVKWYKDQQEFYRYHLDDSHKPIYFPLPGVTIDRARSGDNKLYLHSLTLDSGGEYRCEVAIGVPTFQTDYRVKTMAVRELTEEDLKIIDREKQELFYDQFYQMARKFFS